MKKLLVIAAVVVTALSIGSAQARTSASMRWVVQNCHAPYWCGWQNTVNCENSGQWADSPGQFYWGVQFAYSSMLTAEHHTGVRVTAWPPSQIVNAIWLRDNSRGSDPWPNCPNP